MKILAKSSALALVLTFSTPLFAEDPQWMTENNLVKGVITLQDDSQVQVYGTQADLDKLQQNLANIQSIEVQPSQTDTTGTTTPSDQPDTTDTTTSPNQPDTTDTTTTPNQ